VIVVPAVFLAASNLVAYASVTHLQASTAEARAGSLADAARDARTAKRLEPFAARPRLQLALLDERRGDLASALRELEGAIARSRDDWTLWLIRARMEAKAGRVRSADESLRHAVALNPRSPVFTELGLRP
jgi:Tfp pilus assembly protein PilF